MADNRIYLPESSQEETLLHINLPIQGSQSKIPKKDKLSKIGVTSGKGTPENIYQLSNYSEDYSPDRFGQAS